MFPANKNVPLDEARLEQMAARLAYIVMQHGEIYAPLFDAVEAELLAVRQRQSGVDRARRYLMENSKTIHTVAGGLKAIR